MAAVVLTLNITREEYLRVYQGQARTVLAYDHAGRKINFPVSVLQAFVGHDGVHGTFRLTFDEQHRFQHIERLA